MALLDFGEQVVEGPEFLRVLRCSEGNARTVGAYSNASHHKRGVEFHAHFLGSAAFDRNSQKLPVTLRSAFCQHDPAAVFGQREIEEEIALRDVIELAVAGSV